MSQQNFVRCPRCQFDQPKDIYCVNCGIHMDDFRKKPSTKIHRFLKNPIFHLGVFSLGILAVLTMSETGSFIKRSLNYDFSFKDSYTFESLTPPANVKEKAPSPQRVPAQAKKPVREPATPTTTPRDKKETSYAHVVFLEASQQALNDLFIKSDPVYSRADEQAAFYPDSTENLLKTKLKVLPQGESEKRLESGSALSFPLQFQERTHGFPQVTLRTNWNLNSEGVIFLEVQMDANSEDGSETFYSDEFEIPKGKTLLVSGVLKRDLFKTVPSEWLETPLSILNSRAFLENQTDFLMIFGEIKK